MHIEQDHRGPQNLRCRFEHAPTACWCAIWKSTIPPSSLVAPEKNRFQYKLEGRDPGSDGCLAIRRQAFYNDLPPRNYRFRVMACNNNGVWNQAGVVRFLHRPGVLSDELVPRVNGWHRVGDPVGAAPLSRLSDGARIQRALEERVSERTRLARDLHATLLQSFHGLMLRFQVVSKLLPEGKAKEQLEKTLERADQAIAEGRSAVYDLRSSAH